MSIFAIIIIIASLLSACANEDYLSNRDTITLQAGDAVATNAAAQTIDPWPPSARRKAIAYNGNRMARGMDRYESGKGGLPLPPPGDASSLLPPPPQ